MNPKFNDRYMISINVERSVYTKLNKLLPRGVTISDEINEFLKQRLRDFEKGLKVYQINSGPIRICENVESNSILEGIMEPTLDIYSPKLHLVTHVQKIANSQTAWTLKRNAKLVVNLAETKAKELAKENK